MSAIPRSPSLLATFEHCIPCDTFNFTDSKTCNAKGSTNLSPNDPDYATAMQNSEPQKIWVTLSTGDRIYGTISLKDGVLINSGTYRDGEFEIHERDDHTIRVTQVAHECQIRPPKISNFASRLPTFSMRGIDQTAQVGSYNLNQAVLSPSLAGADLSHLVSLPSMPTAISMNVTGPNVRVGGKLTANQTGVARFDVWPPQASAAEHKASPPQRSPSKPASPQPSSIAVIIGEATHCDSCGVYTFNPIGTIENKTVTASVNADGFSASSASHHSTGHKNGIFKAILCPSGRIIVHRMGDHKHTS